jgi:predicted nuclease of predicted toxin-antitoxin system
LNLKLDKNVDIRIASQLSLAANDVATVSGQGLVSASDEEVINACLKIIRRR